jgi:hypothetical protein
MEAVASEPLRYFFGETYVSADGWLNSLSGHCIRGFMCRFAHMGDV